MESQVRNQSIAAIIIIMMCCVAIFLFGCAENPAAPNINDTGTAAIEDGPTSSDSLIRPLNVDTVFVACDTVSELVDSLGDTLKLHIQGKRVDFFVPAGALSDTVTISIIGTRYRIGNNMDLYTYECGPSGLQFAIPLELTQLINRSNGAQATLWYYDESAADGDGSGWESISVSSVLGGRGTFLLSHFSKYGVSYAMSPGGQYGDIETETNLN
ncbi:MAG: hypothetical protein WBP29_06130 [Candidatus Zixiibacteriota bacterium]